MGLTKFTEQAMQTVYADFKLFVKCHMVRPNHSEYAIYLPDATSHVIRIALDIFVRCIICIYF